MEDFWIAGYAAPFNSPAIVEGVEETIAPGAFMIGRRCEVRLWEHDGAPVASSYGDGLRLWQDDYGLAFLARINSRYLVHTAHAVRRENFQCSVQFTAAAGRAGFDATVDVVDGVIRRRVTRASIEHIALAHGAIYGAGTGAWIAGEPTEDYDPSIRALARRWKLPKPAGAAPAPSSAGSVVSPDTAAQLSNGWLASAVRRASRPPHAPKPTGVPPSARMLLDAWLERPVEAARWAMGRFT